MLQEEQFIILINKLKNLSKEKLNQTIQQRQSLEDFFLKSIETFNTLYEIEQKRLNEKYVEPFAKEYSFLEQKSVLQVIRKHHWETFHSLLLKHLWQQPRLLYSFIDRINRIENKELILQQIILDNYKIEVEHPIKNKKTEKVERFIDLLITDNNKKWLIVIENKIYSEVSKNKSGKGTQLSSYYNYIKNDSHFKSFDNKIYILLSHCDNTKYTNNEWIYTDYYNVFSSMLRNNDADNAIQLDYLKTLYQLLFNDRSISSDLSLYTMRKFYIEVQSKVK
ncbi:PD-(D/E)XK nuclease family protein [Dysgonomonas massiliensis]|uniref:PD-(D/E)XK nuclease family protein n=1 Tax=Dysgonomonas massiliensis TaxID=2040292 RepID=UPI000C786A9D|nr:PD-(D/E)XK nuclease family protein [Dysgonomonas massiliensis]